jgi:hypothetical protein
MATTKLYMFNKLSATKKGLVTGIAMIAVSLLFALNTQLAGISGIGQYLIYFIYTGGVIWALVVFGKTKKHGNTFKEFFNEGFRCFIVVTLLMVVYTFVFSKMNTAYRDATAGLMKDDLLKQGNLTPAEIENQVSAMKRNFALMMTAPAVFFYLIIGALVTAVASAFITRNKD